MKLYSKQEAIARMNMLAGCSKSFVFLIDYSQEQVYVEETAEVSPEELIYNLNGFTNEAVAGLTDELLSESLPEQIEWISQPVSFREYSRAFRHVKKNILAGNSFLTNLTCRTPVQTNLTLKDIYCSSRALYKVWVKNRFVVFSPEIFVRIKKGIISSYPMKGKLQNLAHHNRRMNETRQAVFGMVDQLDILNYIEDCPESGFYKCRVVYGREVCEVTFSVYTIRAVRSLRLVGSDTIDYRYKSTNRKELEALYALRDNQDDVLIVRNNLLTDTSIANVALEKEGVWYTPRTPLLKGTKRALLLEQGVLTECDIPSDEISSYSHIALFNAMIDFQSLVLEINRDTVIRI